METKDEYSTMRNKFDKLKLGNSVKSKTQDPSENVSSNQSNHKASQYPFDKPRSSSPNPFDKPRSSSPNPFDKPRSSSPNPFDKPRSTSPNPFDKPRSSSPNPFDKPRAASPNPFDKPRAASPNPFEKPKVARKLELYRMEPILIPAFNNNEQDNNKLCSPEQNELIKQVHSMEIECHYCNEPIQMYDEKIMIGQNFYHSNHVQCNKCGQVLDQNKILELGDDIFCDVCFENECNLGKNRCGYCNEEIFGDLYIKALNKVWHPNHFFCSYCGCKFNEEVPFFEIDGKPYCEEDYSRLFGKICKGCNEVINADFISAMEMFWHNECFKCHICNKSLIDEAFYCIDGELYCEPHYQEKENFLCDYCKKPVDKRYVFALNKKWHPNHFFCNFCKNVLYTDSGFREYKDKPYCKDCFIRLYG